MQTYLTKNGNILLRDVNGKFSFHTPSLAFIREVSEEEGEYIISNKPTEIDVICKLHDDFTDYCAGLGEFPTWHFVKSVLVMQDNTNYKAELSSNGGCYAFQIWHDWFVAKYPDGSWKFAYVERHDTSAEFSFDELTGQFQSDLGWVCLSNVAGNQGQYHSQRGICWKEGEKNYTVETVLEKIAIFSTFEQMWNQQYEIFDGEEESAIFPALSFKDKREIIAKLQELYESTYSKELEEDVVFSFRELHKHLKKSASRRWENRRR